MSKLTKIVTITPDLTSSNWFVYVSGELVLKACHLAIVELTEKYGLTVFDKITVKRAIKMLNESGYSAYSKYFLSSPLQIACLDDDLPVINKYLKSRNLLDIVKAVYEKLQARQIHPSGEFDKNGRWYADNSDFISCRSPSRAWPYSEMTACRTLKYVKKVAAYYEIENESQLINLV